MLDRATGVAEVVVVVSGRPGSDLPALVRFRRCLKACDEGLQGYFFLMCICTWCSLRADVHLHFSIVVLYLVFPVSPIPKYTHLA